MKNRTKDILLAVVGFLLLSNFSAFIVGELYGKYMSHVSEVSDIILAEGEIIGFLIPSVAVIPIILYELLKKRD